MAFSARAIANTILEIAWGDSAQITPMKLQKLVYLSHGWNLGLLDEPLINEQVEAWKYGPVIRTLYHAFKEYGNEPITEYAMRVKVLKDGPKFGFKRLPPTISGPPTRALLKRIWSVYGGHTAGQLSNLTHRPGSPWDIIAKKYDGEIPRGTDIPQSLIKRYFKKLAAETE